jgi:hypothetical protein
MNPVQFQVQRQGPPARVHLLIRLLLLLALGGVGISSIYWLLYLIMPPVTAALVSQKGSDRYFAETAPTATRVLRWLAGFYAYLWLLTDEFPTGEGSASVHFELTPRGTPTATSALVRLISSLPALLLLVLLSLVVCLLWLFGALTILIARKLPAAFADFIAMTLRLQFRLAAYHLSLVDAYPSPGEGVAHEEPPVSA